MPVFLKDFKKSLERDWSKKGVNSKGDYKSTPPNIISRKIKDYPSLPVSKITSIERPGLNAISFSGLVQSESSSIKYKATVQFHEVSFADTSSVKNSVQVEIDEDGETVTKFHEPIKLKKHPVMIKCQCDDFRHRFETQAADNDALIGRPRKYRRKTPAWPVGHPYANATDKIGFCKHINSLLIALNKGDKVDE